VIEIISFVVILTSTNYLDVVINFMALAVIAEFDDKFYNSLGNDCLKNLIEKPDFDDLYRITRTSSKNCSENDILDDETCEDPSLARKVDYLQLGPSFLLMRMIYKCFRVI
jgi:hypothetical protein